MRRKLLRQTLLCFIAILTVIYASAQLTVVTSCNMNGWSSSNSGTGGVLMFENGPAAPPLPTGSVEFTVGAGDVIMLSNPNYHGVRLAHLTALTYSTYAEQSVLGQAVRLELLVDLD